MRNLIVLSILGTFCLSGCGLSIKVTDKNSNKTIKGNGIEVTQNRTITDFGVIKCSAPVNLEIISGNSTSLTISGDENLVEMISTECRGNNLIISANHDNVQLDGKIDIKVITPNPLSGLNLSGMGHVIVKVTSDKDNFAADISGMGHLSMPNIETKSLKMHVSGMGKVECAGIVSFLAIDNSGMGKLNLEKLHAKDVVCNSSGMGKASIYASESLTVNVSGMGDIVYYGNPKKVAPKVSGMGKLEYR